jgi:hypothetical protein
MKREVVMANPVLEVMRAERAEQISNMDAILGQVENRDLSEAERGLLERARDRIGLLDEQISPLAEFEALRSAHDATVGALPRPALEVGGRRADMSGEGVQYRSAGTFLVDYLRAHGIMERGVPDDQAAARLAYAQRADQTTGDTPGLLPVPIVGQVVSLVDANRPLITSLGGAKALGGIPGTSFTRPKVTVHTQVGKQAAEKTALASRKMTVAGITFTKETHGGYVDISRQDIDWTSPAAWDILVRDLAQQYAIETETAVATQFVTSAVGAKPPALPAAPVLADWTHALYTAAMHSYSAGQMMPDRLWVSLDVWAALGSLVDTTRVVLPPDARAGGDSSNGFDIGGSSLADFRGDVLGLPRVVVPLLPPKTCIIGPASLFEVYEEVLGLLSVIEPSILGVQVAYGGYVAYGGLAGSAFVPLDLSAVTNLPTMAEAEETAADDAPAPSTRAK